jgi:excisionase family DNA binding protein
MTTEQAKKLSFIVRQMRDVVKRSIDELTELAEAALFVSVNDETPSRKILPQSIQNENRLLNKKEIAQRLGVSVRTISNLQTEGLPTQKIGKRVLFNYEKVLLWLEGREIKSRRKNNLRMVK